MKKSLIALAAMSAMGASAAAGWSRRTSDEPRGHALRTLDAGGLLANIDSTTLNDNKHMQAFGDGTHPSGRIALTANPAAADLLRILRIPAGTRVSAVMTGNTDLDSNGAPTFVYSLGFVPVVAADGPAQNLTYFGPAGDTALQATNLGKLYANFDPITFEKDVYLVMAVGTAAATFAAGTIRAAIVGEARGVK